MKLKKSVLKIPIDPRSSKNIFLTLLPSALKNKIYCDEWKEYVENLNQIILQHQESSFLAYIKLLGLGSFIDSLRKPCNKPIRKYIDQINEKLKYKGIYVRDPCENGLIELVVEIYENADSM